MNQAALHVVIAMTAEPAVESKPDGVRDEDWRDRRFAENADARAASHAHAKWLWDHKGGHRRGTGRRTKHTTSDGGKALVDGCFNACPASRHSRLFFFLRTNETDSARCVRASSNKTEPLISTKLTTGLKCI